MPARPYRLGLEKHGSGVRRYWSPVRLMKSLKHATPLSEAEVAALRRRYESRGWYGDTIYVGDAQAPTRPVSRLTFQLVAARVWDDEEIALLEGDFVTRFGGMREPLTPRSAALVRREVIEVPD